MFINDLEKEVNREVTKCADTNQFSEVKTKAKFAFLMMGSEWLFQLKVEILEL